MSGSGSEHQEGAEESRLFAEGDGKETRMGYDHGGVPLYVAVVWVLFLASYVMFMVYYALPDLSAWGSL